uniref:Uncharacterized protein n=1 Tax=Romanomermis culicivorax TaxID=13658 RepID=A0A915HLD8_ROMCU
MVTSTPTLANGGTATTPPRKPFNIIWMLGLTGIITVIGCLLILSPSLKKGCIPTEQRHGQQLVTMV